jgi:hypothetical protein
MKSTLQLIHAVHENLNCVFLHPELVKDSLFYIWVTGLQLGNFTHFHGVDSLCALGVFMLYVAGINAVPFIHRYNFPIVIKGNDLVQAI